MTDGLEQFHQTFFEESLENLDSMESMLLALNVGTPDPDVINAIFRAAHSIKGGAGAFHFTEVARFTHVLETVLDALRERRISVDQAMIDLLLISTDSVRELLDAGRTGREADAAQVESIRTQLQALLGEDLDSAAGPTASTGSREAVSRSSEDPGGWRISFIPHRDLLHRGSDPIRLFRGLEELGALEVRVSDSELPPFSEIVPEDCYLAWELDLRGVVERAALEDLFDWVTGECDIEIAPLSSGQGHSLYFGEIAVERGFMEEEQRAHVLAMQENDTLGRKFGVLAAALGHMTLSQVEQVLAQQLERLEGAADARANQSSDSCAAPAPDVPRRSRRFESDGNFDLKVATSSREAASIRVGTSKIDALVNLVGELVITQSMLGEVGKDLDMSRVETMRDGLAQLERNTRELQEAVMRIRMLPMGMIFNRFPRMIRDMSRDIGKSVELVLSGEQTEVDKTVLEQIGDPLVHLLRNALDHGIETPEQRAQAGKPRTGTLQLIAAHVGGNIIIELADDGGGIDVDGVLKAARARGLIADDESLTEEEAIDLLFAPGFSTAEQVTDLSGRGVGMDVVRRNINALGGSIEVKSRKGKGTTFTIRLPLTVAILDGQLLRVGTETYVLSLVSIIETIQIESKYVNVLAGGVETYRVREEYVPIIRMHQIFGIRTEHSELDRRLLVLVEGEGKKAGLLVDELLAQQQVVIKSLETNYRKVEGISGATILGDGTVALIMDVTGIMHAFYGGTSDSARVAA